MPAAALRKGCLAWREFRLIDADVKLLHCVCRVASPIQTKASVSKFELLVDEEGKNAVDMEGFRLRNVSTFFTANVFPDADPRSAADGIAVCRCACPS
jgi:hypothetical protein